MNDSTNYPLNGINLEGIFHFVADCSENLLDLTTDDVCEKYVKKATKVSQNSYCDFIRSSKPGETFVSKATVFVSHAWKYKFLDVVDALASYEKKSKTKHFFWFDIFSNNQNFKGVPPAFQWWCSVFINAIQDIGSVVMVLDPLTNPVTLTRAWCLWEIYAAVKTGSSFAVAMSETTEKLFEEMIFNDEKTFFYEMLGNIDVENSKAGVQIDEENIKLAVKEDIGFGNLNSMVISCIRKWVISYVEDKIEYFHSICDMVNWHLYRCKLGSLYMLQNSLGEAEEIFRDCLSYQESIVLIAPENDIYSDMSIVDRSYDLACCLLEQMRMRIAFSFYDNANIAEFDRKNPKYDEAMVLLAKCIDTRKKKLGTRNKLTLQTIAMGAFLDLDISIFEMKSFKDVAKAIWKTFERDRENLTDEDGNEKSVIEMWNEFFYEDEIGELRLMEVTARNILLMSRNKLRDFIKIAHESELAYSYASRCYLRRNKLLGKNHPETLFAMCLQIIAERHRALFHDESYSSNDKIQCFKDCLYQLSSKFGDRSKYSLMIRWELSNLLYSEGMYKDALDHLIFATTEASNDVDSYKIHGLLADVEHCRKEIFSSLKYRALSAFIAYSHVHESMSALTGIYSQLVFGKYWKRDICLTVDYVLFFPLQKLFLSTVIMLDTLIYSSSFCCYSGFGICMPHNFLSSHRIARNVVCCPVFYLLGLGLTNWNCESLTLIPFTLSIGVVGVVILGCECGVIACLLPYCCVLRLYRCCKAKDSVYIDTS